VGRGHPAGRSRPGNRRRSLGRRRSAGRRRSGGRCRQCTARRPPGQHPACPHRAAARRNNHSNPTRRRDSAVRRSHRPDIHRVCARAERTRTRQHQSRRTHRSPSPSHRPGGVGRPGARPHRRRAAPTREAGRSTRRPGPPPSRRHPDSCPPAPRAQAASVERSGVSACLFPSARPVRLVRPSMGAGTGGELVVGSPLAPPSRRTEPSVRACHAARTAPEAPGPARPRSGGCAPS